MSYEKEDKCLSPNPNLIYDESCLDIINSLSTDITIYGQYKECDKCLYSNLTTVAANSNTSILINSKYSLRLLYSTDAGNCR